jgi:hypothetical protein
MRLESILSPHWQHDKSVKGLFVALHHACSMHHGHTPESRMQGESRNDGPHHSQQEFGKWTDCSVLEYYHCDNPKGLEHRPYNHHFAFDVAVMVIVLDVVWLQLSNI